MNTDGGYINSIGISNLGQLAATDDGVVEHAKIKREEIVISTALLLAQKLAAMSPMNSLVGHSLHRESLPIMTKLFYSSAIERVWLFQKPL
jgi:hypothetical protein